ncbi:hypothetical protein LCGC14_0551090 [marine sediment metagenome]|uniref:DUF721 domain-containing protein n=1 Tax=marine sediment metagenome TaxID=412755 RepID=A0A0F9UY41_9ZZZZ|nr:DUF721 domain-containing protein [Methylophaga sp.]HEC59863.1 DUF721 domain-containing protein [Methylophaga sp.]
MTNKPEKVSLVYKQNSQLYKIAQRAQKLNHLNYIVQQVMPPQFSAHCLLANINNQTIIIHTDNASYASLLRFQASTLCKVISEHTSQNITKLEVKVKPSFQAIQPTNVRHISLPSNAAESLSQTADNLDDGPLKTALQKLAQRYNKS